MGDRRPVPTLDQVAADPAQALALPMTTAFELLSRCLTVQGALVARLGVSLNEHVPPAAESALDSTRWLPVDDAAALMGVNAAWLRRNWKRFPFAQRISRKNLVFHEVRLRRWLEARKGT
jgi:hypothetical protein